MMKFMYKLSKSVIPCMLLTLSIGFCYAWSLFAPEIRAAIPDVTTSQVQFAFCLNIFFLGMGAAFFGRLVEKRIKLAACVSNALLFIGLQVAALGVACKSLMLVYLGFGVCCGISEGCGYVVPVKNLLLWWGKTKHKGVIMAMSIIFFGLGSTLCSWMFGLMQRTGCDVVSIMQNMSYVYLAMMSFGCIMIRKPKYAQLKLKKEQSNAMTSDDKAKLRVLIKDPFFRRSWIFMFLNISMGLVLIGTCASLLKNVACLKPDAVIAVMMACGIANGAGRLVFPFISDYMKTRLWIWILILAIEVVVTAFSALWPVLLPIGAVFINATYGAAFSTLPSVLNDHYGKAHLSEIHGLVLSSWGFASLFAYAVTVFGVSSLPFIALMLVLCSMYSANLRVVHGMFKIGKQLK